MWYLPGAIFTDWVHCCTPPPHETLQSSQLPNTIAQSTGQSTCVQTRPSFKAAHVLPPAIAALCTCLVRTLLPAVSPTPHEALHFAQKLQAPTAQSNGHGCVLQDLVSCSKGQALPPDCARCTIERELRRVKRNKLKICSVEFAYSLTTECEYHRCSCSCKSSTHTNWRLGKGIWGTPRWSRH